MKAMDRYELRDAFSGVPSSLDMKYGVAVIIALAECQKEVEQHLDSALTIPWEEHGAAKYKVYGTDLAIHNDFGDIFEDVHGILFVENIDVKRVPCRACCYRSLGYRLVFSFEGGGPSRSPARHR